MVNYLSGLKKTPLSKKECFLEYKIHVLKDRVSTFATLVESVED